MNSSLEGNLISPDFNDHCPVVILYLPHVRHKVEHAFQEWQQTTVSKSVDGFPLLVNDNKAQVVTTRSVKGVDNAKFDSNKQPFRPEKRYRRR